MRMKQRDIALKVQISESYMSEIINCKRRPSWDLAKKLALATSTSPVFWMEATQDQRRAVVGKGPQAKQNLACAPDENPEAERRAEERRAEDRRSGDRRKSCVSQCD